MASLTDCLKIHFGETEDSFIADMVKREAKKLSGKKRVSVAIARKAVNNVAADFQASSDFVEKQLRTLVPEIKTIETKAVKPEVKTGAAKTEPINEAPAVEIAEKGKTKEVSIDIPAKEAEALTPKEQKTYLLAEIDRAIEKYNKDLTDYTGEKKENVLYKFNVPGDGEFDILGNKLADFKKRVQSHFPEKTIINEKFKPSQTGQINYAVEKKKFDKSIGNKDVTKLSTPEILELIAKQEIGSETNFINHLLSKGANSENVKQATKELGITGKPETEYATREQPTSTEKEAKIADFQEAKGIKIDIASLSDEILSKMNRTLKAMGYDVRGTDDIKALLESGGIMKDGVLWQPDWISAYQKATESKEARIATKAKKAESKNISWSRLRELGKTTDLREAGYLSPDGSMIDLSGKREGGEPRTRSYDHREAGGTIGMQELMANGYIRFDHNSGMLDMMKEPTSKQYGLIRESAISKNGELIVELEDGLGNFDERNGFYSRAERTFYREYPEGTKPARIVNDIKIFYSGKEPMPMRNAVQYSTRIRGVQEQPSGATLTLEDLQSLKPFQGGTVLQHDDGWFSVSFPGNKGFFIKLVSGIDVPMLTPADLKQIEEEGFDAWKTTAGKGRDATIAFHIEHGRGRRAKEIIAGSYTHSDTPIIHITKGVGDKWTVTKELQHFLEKSGLLTNSEIEAIERQAQRFNKGDYFGTNGRARWVEQELKTRSKKRESFIGRLIQKIADILDGFWNLIKQTARGAVRAIESGKIMTRTAQAEVNEFAQPVEYSLKQAVKNIMDNPNFRKWFGKSKVLDADGKPLVVYHGTAFEFNKFDPEAEKNFFRDEVGFFFTNSKEDAASYAEYVSEMNFQATRKRNKKIVMETYLSIENPEIIETDTDPANWIDGNLDTKYAEELANEKFDGIIINGEIDGKATTHYVVFKPTQIKSIFNRGTFDPTNPDIAYTFVGPKGATTEGIAVDFSKNQEWHDIAYKDPTDESLGRLKKWLKNNPDAIVRMYHGTNAELPILEDGLKPTGRRTAKSLQARHGVVSLSIYPEMAETFGRMAYPGKEIKIYAVDIPVNLLVPDTDQLKNKRLWGQQKDIGETLADSIAYGHGAQVKGRIDPWRIKPISLLKEGQKPEDVLISRKPDDVVYTTIEDVVPGLNVGVETGKPEPLAKFVITNSDKAALKAKGLTDANIDKMTPIEVERMLKPKETKGTTLSMLGTQTVYDNTTQALIAFQNKFNVLKDWKNELIDAYTKPAEITETKKIIGKYTGALQIIDKELSDFAKDINKKIPKDRQIAITNYMQAGGDETLLKERVAGSKERHRQGYKDALTLTNEEKLYADTFRKLHDDVWQEANDADIIEDYVQNYVRGEWKRPDKAGKKLVALANSGYFRTMPKEALHKVFQNYFEGESAGFDPVDKRIGYQVVATTRSIKQAIEARKALKSLMSSTEKDGRPTVAVGGAGTFSPAEGASTEQKAYYIKPNAMGGDLSGYKYFDPPAFRKWKWVGEDVNGKPILLQGNMWVHPDAYPKLNALLGKSAIRGYTIPEKVPIIGGTQPGRAALEAGAFVKGTILLGPFHQFHVSEHAVFHKVNPFGLPEIDFDKRPLLKDGVEHGLMLYNHNALAEFGEGLASGGLFHKIPVAGDVLLRYQTWLFQDYIPKLKAAMFEHAVERAKEYYKKDLVSGKFTMDQLLENAAKQANAAFGEQNYKYMGRNPTLQDALRIGLLAPDFLEARLRFAGQAAKPKGKEQTMALIRGAIIMAVTAQIINILIGDDHKPHWNRPFNIIIGSREYTPRSVVGDIFHLIKDPRNFWYHRINPLWGKPLVAIASGKDAQGRKAPPEELAKDVLESWIPIPGQGFVKKKMGKTFFESIVNALLQSVGVSNYPFKTDFEKYALEREKHVTLSRSMAEKVKLKREFADELREKVPGAKEHILAAKRAGKLEKNDIIDIVEKAKKNPTAIIAESMDLEDLAKGANKANDEERKIIAPIFKKKCEAKASELDAPTKLKYRAILKELYSSGRAPKAKSISPETTTATPFRSVYVPPKPLTIREATRLNQ